MVSHADNLLPLAVLVFASLIVLIAVIVRLVRSGRVPLLAARGHRTGGRPGPRG